MLSRIYNFGRRGSKNNGTPKPLGGEDSVTSSTTVKNGNKEQIPVMFIGHTTEDSPVHNHETDGFEDYKYFQEELAGGYESPCESYVSVHESDNFDPMEIDCHPETISTFLSTPLSISLLSVPGIGVKERYILQKSGIENTHQIIGQFLMFRGTFSTPIEISNIFYKWLGEIGIMGNRANITSAIAKKIGTWLPGVYDTNMYK